MLSRKDSNFMPTLRGVNNQTRLRESFRGVAEYSPLPVMRRNRVLLSLSGTEQFHCRYWNWYWHCLTARFAPYLMLAISSRFSSHHVDCLGVRSMPLQKWDTVPTMYTWCGILSDLFEYKTRGDVWLSNLQVIAIERIIKPLTLCRETDA